MNTSINPHKLYRNPKHAMLAGVCAGLADYFGLSRTLVRFLYICGLIFAWPVFFLAYIVMIFAVPKRPEVVYVTSEDEVFWRAMRFTPKVTFTDLRHTFRQMEERMRRMENYVTSSEFDFESEYRNMK